MAFFSVVSSLLTALCSLDWGSQGYYVSIFPGILYVTPLSFVVQKPFSQLSSLRGIVLYVGVASVCPRR